MKNKITGLTNNTLWRGDGGRKNSGQEGKSNMEMEKSQTAHHHLSNQFHCTFCNSISLLSLV